MLRLSSLIFLLLLSSSKLFALGMEVTIEGPDANKNSWKKACPIVARNFLESKVILKPALVDKYKCSLVGKPGKLSDENPWKLIIQTSDDLVFKLYYYNTKAASLSLPMKASIYPYLRDEKLMRLVAYTLIDQAHYQFVIRSTSENINSIYEQDFFARDISVFTSSYDLASSSHIVTRVAQYRSDYVVPAVENPETLDKKTDIPNAKAKKNTKSKPKPSKKFKYSKVSSQRVAPMQMRKPLYAINSLGKGANHAVLTQSINDHLKEKYDLELSREILSEAGIFSSFSSGSVGVRYGKSLVKDSPLLEQADTIGLLAEFRHGALDGLRFYWDFAPQVEESYDATNNLSLSWNRAVVGWAFYTSGFGLSDSFSLTPRLGLIQYEANISTDDIAPLEFSISNSITVGLELDYEYDLGFMLTRLWVGIDYGIKAINPSGTANSYRAGLDVFYYIYDIGKHGHLDVVGFGYIDSFEINQDNEDNEENDELNIEYIKYNQYYAGLGLLYSW